MYLFGRLRGGVFREAFVFHEMTRQTGMLFDFAERPKGADLPLLLELLACLVCQLWGTLMESFVAGHGGVGWSPNNPYWMPRRMLDAGEVFRKVMIRSVIRKVVIRNRWRRFYILVGCL